MGQGAVKYENLSVNEARRIRDSWTLVRKQLSKIGLHIFTEFFERHPQHKKYFSRPGGVDVLLEDELEMHSLKIMREISQIVRNIESTDNILYMVRLNALNHRKFHIDPSAYDDFRICFVSVLTQHMKSEQANDIAIAWDKGLKIIFQIITDINYEGPTTVGVSRLSRSNTAEHRASTNKN